MEKNRILFDGLYFDDIGIEQAARTVINAVKSESCGYAVTPNGCMAQKAFFNKDFASLLKGAFLCLPDGVGITLGARLLGSPFQKGRAPGVELGEKVAEYAAKEGFPLYFFGGKQGVAQKAAQNLAKRYRGLMVAGISHGYEKELDTVVARIQNSKAAIVFCCLGSPLQEIVAAKIIARHPAIVLCLGGSLDVYAGQVKRAPDAFRRMGCEWLWRTANDPRRITRLPSLCAFTLRILSLKMQKTIANRPIKRYNK